MRWPYKKYLHVMLPTALLLLYLIGLLIVLALALALLPLTLLNWLIHRKGMKWYDAAPSFWLIERYWKILAEK